MAGSVNKAILVGHLGQNPEVRTTQSGTKTVTLNLATSERWKDKQTGERRGNTEWHRVVIFNERLADVAEKYLSKGRKIYVEGVLKTRKYNDSQGVEKRITEVILDRFRGELVLLDSKDQNQSGSNNSQGGWESSMLENNNLDDEIPF